MSPQSGNHKKKGEVMQQYGMQQYQSASMVVVTQTIL